MEAGGLADDSDPGMTTLRGLALVLLGAWFVYEAFTSGGRLGSADLENPEEVSVLRVYKKTSFWKGHDAWLPPQW